MRPSLVIDASVAIKWVYSEEQSDEALLIARSYTLYAPELILFECANILWKKARRGELSEDEAAVSAGVLARTEIELVATKNLAQEATRLACLLGHPAYDCFYLCAAGNLDARFATADESLIRKLQAAKQPKWSSLCISLSEAARIGREGGATSDHTR